MTKLLQSLTLVLVIALLTSCAVPQKQPSQPNTPSAEYPADLQGAQLYRVAADQSTLRILVYRGGTMAQLGHNHVITSTSIAGYAWLHDSLSKSGFNLSVPVNELIIDDQRARDAEGADFASKVSEAARDGTKTNMLKSEQLDGEHYPVIRLQAVNIQGSRERTEVKASITIKNQTHEVNMPVHLTVSGNSLRAVGEFRIKQTDFGMKPYSVAMGALQVQDEMTIKFELVALAIK